MTVPKRTLKYEHKLEDTYKHVILTDDKNNIVHEMFRGMLTCNHIPLEEDEYEEVTDEPVNCEHCQFMNEVYDQMAKEISEHMDKQILDDISRGLFNE